MLFKASEKLITDVRILTDEKEYGYMAEGGTIHNFPIPYIGKMLNLYNSKYIVVGIYFMPAVEYGGPYNIREITVIEKGMECPDEITSYNEWERYQETRAANG